MTSRAESARTDTQRAAGFQHRGMFFFSEEDLRGRVLPRLRSALGRGERTAVALAPHTRAAILSGLDPADAVAVEVVERAELYDAPGRTLAALHRRARAEHPQPVLLVGEPPLPSEDPVRLREWHRLDSVMTGALAGTGLRLLCVHDGRALPAPVRRDIRRTHPVLLTPDDEHGSPDYVDPAVFSAPDIARPLPAPAEQPSCLEITADLASLRTELTELAEKAQVPAWRLDDLVLAVNELAANVVEHGGGSGNVSVWQTFGWTVCDVLDRRGGPIDPLGGYHTSGPYESRGYGLWITRQLCDFMEIGNGTHGALVRLHFRT